MWVVAYKHGRNAYPNPREFPDAAAFFADYTSEPFPVVEHKMAPSGVDPKNHPPCPMCAPSWSPVRTDYRSNAAVTELWALVLDFDDVTPDQRSLLFHAAEPFVGLLHTSLNHYRKPDRWRAIFPFRGACPPGRLPKLFAAYESYFGAKADPVSKAPSAQYYIGRYADDPLPIFWQSLGTRYLDPWDLPGSETFTREDLLDLAKKYKNKDRKLSERLHALATGEPFAEPIELGDGRDAAAFRLCSVIAEHHPLANPERVAELFVASLQRMAYDHPEGALTRERILDKLYRLYSSLTREEEAEETLQRQFWTAHGEPGRVGTYLPSELEQLGSPGPREWVYQAEHGIYIRTHRGFDGPIRQATVRARQALAVVPSIGARDFGPIQALASVHGSAIVEVRQSLRAQRATFDPATRILETAPTPRRALDPEPSAFVAAWFACAFTPDERALVEAWLTLLPDLTRALSCLMLVGDTDTGKNLFAASCARFWFASAPASAKRVLGRFNADVLRCPLVWADEELPKGQDGYFPLEEFMHLSGAADFSIEQKNVEACTIQGYTRWIATANKDLFTSAYSHTNAGNEALAKRVLRVEILPESAAFLADHKDHLSTFVESSELARHVLSLPVHQSKERFGVASPPDFGRTLAVSTVWGGRICEAILLWLLNRTKTDALVLEAGRVWVSGMRLYESWRALNGMMIERPKDARQLLDCLSPICIPLRHGGYGSRKQIGRLKYREIDMAKIRHWAASNDWATDETIDAALAPQERAN